MKDLNDDIENIIHHCFGERPFKIIKKKYDEDEFYPTWFIHIQGEKTGYNFIFFLCQHAGYTHYKLIDNSDEFEDCWKLSHKKHCTSYSLGIEQRLSILEAYRLTEMLNDLGIVLAE